MRRLSLWALVSLGAVGGAAGVLGLAPAARAQGNDLTGQRAPEIYVQEGVQGIATGTSLASYRGQVVVLKFWFTRCPSCIRSMPEFQSLYQRFAPRGVRFVAIAYDDTNRVHAYLRSTGFTFPVAVDSAGVTSTRYGVFTYPTTYVIGADGTVKAYDALSAGLLERELEAARSASRPNPGRRPLLTFPRTSAPPSEAVATAPTPAAPAPTANAVPTSAPAPTPAPPATPPAHPTESTPVAPPMSLAALPEAPAVPVPPTARPTPEAPPGPEAAPAPAAPPPPPAPLSPEAPTVLAAPAAPALPPDPVAGPTPPPPPAVPPVPAGPLPVDPALAMPTPPADPAPAPAPAPAPDPAPAPASPPTADPVATGPAAGAGDPASLLPLPPPKDRVPSGAVAPSEPAGGAQPSDRAGLVVPLEPAAVSAAAPAAETPPPAPPSSSAPPPTPAPAAAPAPAPAPVPAVAPSPPTPRAPFADAPALLAGGDYAGVMRLVEGYARAHPEGAAWAPYDLAEAQRLEGLVKAEYSRRDAAVRGQWSRGETEPAIDAARQLVSEYRGTGFERSASILLQWFESNRPAPTAAR